MFLYSHEYVARSIVSQKTKIENIFTSITMLPELGVENCSVEIKQAREHFLRLLTDDVKGLLNRCCDDHQGQKAVKISRLYEKAIKLRIDPNSSLDDRSKATNNLIKYINKSRLSPAVGMILGASLLPAPTLALFMGLLLTSPGFIGMATGSPAMFGVLIFLMAATVALGAITSLLLYCGAGMNDLNEESKVTLREAVQKTHEDFLNEEEHHIDTERSSADEFTSLLSGVN